MQGRAVASSSLFHGSFSRPFQQVRLSHPGTQVTVLAVASVGIEFPFVPLLYEVISTTESDMSLPLGFRDFFFLFVTWCVFQSLSQQGLQAFLGWMDCLQEGKIQGPRPGLPNYVRFPVCSNSSGEGRPSFVVRQHAEEAGVRGVPEQGRTFFF